MTTGTSIHDRSPRGCARGCRCSRRSQADRLGQRGDHLPRAGETLPGRLADRGFDDAGERCGKIGTSVEQRETLAGCVRRAERRQIRALDRVLLRQQIEQHDADGVDVARDRGRLPQQQLRRHVGGRAARIAAAAVFVREPEIHQQDPAALLAHHVAGLDVAVEKAGGMHRADGAADLDADERRFARAGRALPGDELRQREAVDEVAPEPEAPVVLVDAVDRHDVRVPHPRDGTRLTKQRADFLVPCEPAGQEELQRDVALQRGVERAIDFAERAAPDALQVFERSPPIQRISIGAAGQSRFELGLVQVATD